METLINLLESEDVVKTLGDELMKNIYEHKEEFISCFVQSDRVNARNAAFRLLSMPRIKLVRIAAKSDVFRRYLTDIFQNGGPDWEITRLSVVWKNCVDVLRNVCFPDLVLKTISFIELSSVSSLVAAILQVSPSDDAFPLLSIIIERSEKQVELWRLLDSVSDTILLQPTLLSRIIESSSQGKWRILRRIVSSSNLHFFDGIAGQALELITHESFCEYQEHAILFLSRLLDIDSTSLDSCNIEALLEELRRIYVDLHSHTIALNAVNTFIIAYAKSGGMTEQSFHHILKTLYDSILRGKFVASTFAKNALSKISLLSRCDTTISAYLMSSDTWAEVSEIIEEFEESCSRPWFGGNVHSPVRAPMIHVDDMITGTTCLI